MDGHLCHSLSSALSHVSHACKEVQERGLLNVQSSKGLILEPSSSHGASIPTSHHAHQPLRQVTTCSATGTGPMGYTARSGTVHAPGSNMGTTAVMAGCPCPYPSVSQVLERKRHQPLAPQACASVTRIATPFGPFSPLKVVQGVSSSAILERKDARDVLHGDSTCFRRVPRRLDLSHIPTPGGLSQALEQPLVLLASLSIRFLQLHQCLTQSLLLLNILSPRGGAF